MDKNTYTGRPIAFRFWEEKSKTMMDWNCARQTAFNRGDTQLLYRMMGTDPDIVKMQFTGLCDNYHKQIYEADILKSGQGSLFKVFWHAEDASWCVECFSGEYRGRFELKAYMEENLEVIGNIFEHPHLLNLTP